MERGLHAGLSSPSGNASMTGTTPQSVYDRLAATGVEWSRWTSGTAPGSAGTRIGTGCSIPRLAQRLRFCRQGAQGRPEGVAVHGRDVQGCDLTTIAGRDAELEAVLTRYDQGWFDMWRTDLYTAPREPMPQTYQGVANFLYIHDRLIGSWPGYRYENCCNGGKYKGFAICRRMTFCTMNDDDRSLEDQYDVLLQFLRDQPGPVEVRCWRRPESSLRIGVVRRTSPPRILVVIVHRAVRHSPADGEAFVLAAVTAVLVTIPGIFRDQWSWIERKSVTPSYVCGIGSCGAV